ncbi:MAG: hypothetical protein WD793_04855 [Steroidobacteraceae bacterium]
MRVENFPLLERLQRPEALFAGIGLILLLLLTVLFAFWRWGITQDRFEMLEKQAAEGFIQAPSSTRTVKIDPRVSRQIGIDGSGLPQRIDLLLKARSTRYHLFRVSLLRDDGTLILHADRLVRDSNFDLRLSFNTSVLPNGQYRIRIEGYQRNGELKRFDEARMSVVGR